MLSLGIVLICIILFVIAYNTYGTYLGTQWGIDPSIPTPAHTKEDGVDFVPAKPQILLGHHFASIAGAGPINGPIQAAVFGWLPVLLWIIIGGIFFGGVHDYGSLTASMKNDGKSVGTIVEDYMGNTGKTLFSAFAWLTLILVVAAFGSIVAQSFESTPVVATASLLFMLEAIVFGYFVYRKGANLGIATVIGVIVLFASIYIAQFFPIALSANTWTIILGVYAFVASTAPVWILLQPRDYLNSYLLYTMMIGAFLGILIARPEIQLEKFTGFRLEGANGSVKFLFPTLFITVACGAISGFHSLVGSGTTSKQIDNEKDAKLIGYGAMLIECALAAIALVTAAYLTKEKYGEILADKGPTVLFSMGIADFMTKFGIPYEHGLTFVTLSVSAFALTTLDTATRLARFIFQEFFEKNDGVGEQPALTNKWVSTTITVVVGFAFALKGYKLIWPIFGSANQLLAGLALLGVAGWLKGEKKNYKMIIAPMFFMFAATLTALIIETKNYFAKATLEGGAGNWIMTVLPIVLFILALVLMKVGFQVLFGKDKNRLDNK
ncbi:carbon starvation CstA family protein [Peptoniphilus sp.]|jgi:carbon starvation protein|uniref:carbon starvation CstA family protein n=1 Tax=Peptoniphilus sp. TaxID=1971214 RepID=UPI003D8AFDB5